jgi:hypothetical protein
LRRRGKRIDEPKRGRALARDQGERAMEIILALAVLLAIWVLVIWGSSYFNKNVV